MGRLYSRAQHFLRSLCEVLNYDISRIHLQHDPEEYNIVWNTTITDDGSLVGLGPREMRLRRREVPFRFEATLHDSMIRRNGVGGAGAERRTHIIFVFRSQLSDGSWTYENIPSTRRMASRVMSACYGFMTLIFQRYGHRADILSFSTETRYPSRVKMYTRIARRLARDTQGRLEITNDMGDILFDIYLEREGRNMR